MKSVFKVLGIVSGTIIVLAGLLIGAIFLFQDRFKQIAVAQVNEYVKVPIDVKGGIDVTLFSDFPNVSVNLNNVSINDQLRHGKKLVELDKVSLLFSLKEVFSADRKIREIVLKQGTVYLLEDANGKLNFDILNKKNSTGNSNLELQAVVLKNVDLTYVSIPNKMTLAALAKKAKLHGNFGEQILSLKADADFNWKFFKLQSDTFNVNKPLNLSLCLTIDKTKHNIQIEPSTINIAGNLFTANGNVNTKWKDFTELNIDINCKGEEIASLLSLLPNSMQQNLQGAKGTGEYAIDISLSGRTGKNQIPKVLVHTKLKNGTLTLPKLDGDIENINMELMYDNKKEVLSLPKFQAKYNNVPITFSLSAVNINHAPAFNLKAEGIVNFEALQTFIPDEYIKDGKGEIEFKSFELSGNLNEEKQLMPESLNGSGSFIFRDVMLYGGNVEYNNINGLLVYQNGNVQAEGLTVDFLKSQFSFDGTINNFLAYVIEKIKRENHTTLVLNGSLEVKNFNLDEILKAFKKEEKQKHEMLNMREIFNIEGKLRIAVDKFKYRQLLFEDIKSDVLLEEGQIKMNSFSCRAMGGELTNTGMINFTTNQEMVFDGNLQVKQMELPKIFEQSDNFGQTTLTNKHIKGAINADVSYHAVFDDFKNINLPKLTATLKCRITKGELLNFEPLKAASAFIRLEDLNHIYFSDLSNQLIIKNSMVEIPQMEIQSNALNLLLNGTHTFDNKIDYHFKINLRKLLANKLRKNNDSEYIEEDPYEGANLFLSMTGDITKPVIKYDKAYTKNKIADDWKKEKENLKNLFKKDATPADRKDNTRENKYFQKQEKPVFMDFEE